MIRSTWRHTATGVPRLCWRTQNNLQVVLFIADRCPCAGSVGGDPPDRQSPPPTASFVSCAAFFVQDAFRIPARSARIGAIAFYMRRFLRKAGRLKSGHVDCVCGSRIKLRSGEYAMKFKFGMRQALVSSAIFAGIL